MFAASSIGYLDLAYSVGQFVLFLLVPLCTMGFCYCRIACIVCGAAGDPSIEHAAYVCRARCMLTRVCVGVFSADAMKLMKSLKSSANG
jgi:hypothetical protein